MKCKRVAVIGAGFGGLAAATLLADAGHEVRVFEAADSVGGKAGTATVDGVTFDTGPSLLTLPDVPRAIFEAVGADFDATVSLRRLTPAFRHVFHDGVHLDLHDTPEASRAAVDATLGADAGGEWAAFLAYASRIWQASADAFVYGDAPELRALMGLDLGTIAGLRHIDALRTMRDAIDQRVRSPHLRRLLWRFATYNGSDVRAAPATLNCIAAVELVLGGHGVQGGIGALAAALADLGRQRGATIDLGAAVARIEHSGGAVRGVALASGASWSCDLVVCNGDASVIPHLLGRAQPQAAPARSMSAWNAVLRVRRDGRAWPAHQAVYADDYLDEFAAIFDRGEVPARPTVYFCHQGVAHGRGGWADADAVFAMVNAPSLAGATQDLAPEALEAPMRRHVDAALAVLGVDPADAPTVWRRSPVELAGRFPGSDGALYGAASNSMWSAFRRPTNRVRDVRGLYLASGTAHPGGGVPLALLSGVAAARAIAHDTGVAIGAGARRGGATRAVRVAAAVLS